MTSASSVRTVNLKVAIALFVSLLGFWFVLSDQRSLLFLGIGAVSAAFVTWLTAPFVDDVVGDDPHPLSALPAQAWHLAAYVVWVLWRIMVSSLQVAWVVLNPQVPPEPRMLRFRTDLQSNLARVVLANTISLVPGTLTVQLDGDELLVHALVPEAADDLLDGRMQTRVARIFLEGDQRIVDPRWEDPPELRVPPRRGGDRGVLR
jgi:multicomponent Na+:H+ antiporter subunit E